MGKKTITGTKNVYELAQERLKVIFNEFDNIYDILKNYTNDKIISLLEITSELM